MIGGGAGTAFLIFITIYVINTYFLVRPGTNFLTQFEVPAGKVYNSNTKEMVELDAFYMDEYEVTIGQYEKFLRATARLEPAEFKELLPSDYTAEKDNFIPKDWKEIITAVKRKRMYDGLAQHINRDTPIFNIDYADAYAYAKWSGKRLPTELEWMRAAAGNENFKLPWGNEPDLTQANTGADREKSKTVNSAGGLDGYRGLADANAMSKTDVSPFEIKNMAGNVSEWVALSPELGPPKGGDGAQRGGNHGYPVLVSNQKRLNYPLDTRQPWLGIRCVSDQPVVGPKL
jgi:formylglycine-generating enzyme required for sulfatase activity